MATTLLSTQPTKRALLNLNMGIAHTHEIATQIVGMQLSGANVLALIISASSVVAGTVSLAVQRYPTAYVLWVMAGLIGAGLAILIEGLTLGALIRIRLANKAIREVDSRLEEERDEQLATIARPVPGQDPKAYRNAIKIYKMAIATIEQDYRRKRRNATREPRVNRGFSIPVAAFGAVASASAGGIFYHTILADIGPSASVALSALFASVVTGTFVSSELFKDIQEHAIREGFAGGSLMDVAMREETKRLSAQVVHQGILDQMQAPEAQAELKRAALEMMRGIISETFVTKHGDELQPATVVGDTRDGSRKEERALLASEASAKQEEQAESQLYLVTRDDLGMIEGVMYDKVISSPEVAAHVQSVARSTNLAGLTAYLKKQYASYASYITEDRVSRVMTALQQDQSALVPEVEIVEEAAVKNDPSLVTPPVHTSDHSAVISEQDNKDTTVVSSVYPALSLTGETGLHTALYTQEQGGERSALGVPITESIPAIPFPAGGASLSLDPGGVEVLKKYPYVYQRWIVKNVKSVSLDEIVAATGHTKRRLIRYAGKAFIRTPKNANLYTVSSVIKWLKTAPSPNGITEAMPPIVVGRQGYQNGHKVEQEILHTQLEELSVN